ncbi:hypothetical protein [Sphingomonas quercus]|uniref:Uncharacterized protein n=1 Tax=Sphingomonas quercus TaxID=2842451 RepID=A0ABS6BLG2_9SPHN|nr:hypothetical protein [Sphingomonas quercus]MBU3079148.1 hypothetical protein [Sphingomonas quercus]
MLPIELYFQAGTLAGLRGHGFATQTSPFDWSPNPEDGVSGDGFPENVCEGADTNGALIVTPDPEIKFRAKLIGVHASPDAGACGGMDAGSSPA